jgi:GNAT superfamily N-acetyltransferase
MLPSPTPANDETVRIALHQGAREDLWPLFELADGSALAIHRFIDEGVVHVAVTGGVPVGLAQVIHHEEGPYELRRLAVVPGHRRRALGTRLLARSAAWVRDQSGDRLVIGTPAANLDVLGFCQRLGFRILEVERDAFGPRNGYPEGLITHGIPLRDRVWLELLL